MRCGTGLPSGGMLRLLPVVALAAAAFVCGAPAVQAAAASASASQFNNTGTGEAWQALERKLAELLYKLQRQQLQQQQQQRFGDGVGAASPSASLRVSTGIVESGFGERRDEAGEPRVDMQEAVESDRKLQLPPADSLPPREVEKHSAYTSRCRGTAKACLSAYIMGTRQYPGEADLGVEGGGGEGVGQGDKRAPADDSSLRENPANAATDVGEAEDLAAKHPVARRFPWSLPRRTLRLELLKRKLADLYDLVDDLERDDYDAETAWLG